MTCCNALDVLTHYVGESKIYYVDLGEWFKGRTISSVALPTSDDSALTISNQAVLTSETSDYDQQGNAITIEASTGVKFTLSGGTAGAEEQEYTTTVVVVVVTAAGTEIAPVRVKVLDP